MEKTFSYILQQAYVNKPEQVILSMQQAGQPDEQITYAELIKGAVAYESALEKAGIQPGEVVILILQHGIALVNAFWGAILHGAIPSIMPFLTEKLLPERYRASLEALVAITQPAAIVTYVDFVDEVRTALKPDDSVRAVIIAEEITAPEVFELSGMKGLQRAEDDIVLLQHSSGTTGLQKGVALSHRAVLNQLNSYSKTLQLVPEDVIVSWLPLYHDMGLIAGFLMPILSGTHLVLMSPFDWVKAPYKLMQAVSQYRGTLSWLPNFAYNFCAQKVRDRHLEGVDLSSWRAISNCSEPMRWKSHQVFYERFAAYGLKENALTTCYAMAENVFAVSQDGISKPVTIDEVDRESLQVDLFAAPAVDGKPVVKMVSAGRPIQNSSVHILGSQGEVLPERKVGEIALKSDCMLTEYYHRPDATEKAFLDGWYLTGDYGYLADGELYITGRKKDLIIVGGKNVYPRDLEELAMEVEGVHPGRVAAFGVFDERAGTESVVIVAEVETSLSEEREKIEDEIRSKIIRGSDVTLKQVYLVGPNWLVKTSSGKTARSANREKYLQEIA